MGQTKGPGVKCQLQNSARVRRAAWKPPWEGSAFLFWLLSPFTPEPLHLQQCVCVCGADPTPQGVMERQPESTHLTQLTLRPRLLWVRKSRIGHLAGNKKCLWARGCSGQGTCEVTKQPHRVGIRAGCPGCELVCTPQFLTPWSFLIPQSCVHPDFLHTRDTRATASPSVTWFVVEVIARVVVPP